MTNIFGHSVRPELLLLSALEALIGFAVAYGLLAWATDLGEPGGKPGQALLLAALLVGSSALLSGIGGLYRPQTLSRSDRLLFGTGAASLAMLALLLPLASLLGAAARPGSLPVIAAVLLAFSLSVLGIRLGFLAAARHGLLRRRLVVLGGADIAAAGPGVRAGGDLFEVTLAAPSADRLSPEWLRANGVWGIVAADPATVPDPVRTRVRVFGEAEFRERRQGRLDIETLSPGWLEEARATREGAIETALRRAFDITASLGLLLLTLPLLLVTALAIRLDSPGPVFYRQERVGKDNRVFTLFKFRSMVVDAERGGAPRWASKGDPRVTRVGRLIRLTRIDEIPQVLNVLKGDMAFIGPRPERPAFVETLAAEIPHYHDRAVVKPGITGWAQVSYPYGASVEDARMKLAYDLYYIRRRSLFLDFLIVLATIRVVLFQEGAR